MAPAPDRHPLLESLLEAADDEVGGLAEPGQGAGARAHVADLDLAVGGLGGRDRQRREPDGGAHGRCVSEEPAPCERHAVQGIASRHLVMRHWSPSVSLRGWPPLTLPLSPGGGEGARSEERRVGKEGCARGWTE